MRRQRPVTDGGTDEDRAEASADAGASEQTGSDSESGLSRWYEAAASGVNSFSLGPLSRTSPEENVRLLFYNAWLLDGIYLPEVELGPLGTVDPGYLGGIPAVDSRTRDLQRALSESNYDIVALCEVFKRTAREQLAEEVDGVTDSYDGPGPVQLERIDIPSKHSGLHTLVTGENELTGTGEVSFEHRGNYLRDADFYANKGAQHVEVDVGPGRIDLFSTHLIHGGDLNIDPENIPFSEPKSIDQYRTEQLEELAAFIDANQHPENVTVVVGDFNLNAAAGAQNDEMLEAFEQFKEDCSLYDAWERHGGPVSTTYIEHGPPGGIERAKVDPSHPDYLEDHGERCSYPEDVPDRRIDYILVEEPDDDHEFEFDVEHIRRRHFWRGKTTTREFWVDDENGEPNYISDHIGLDIEFGIR